MKSKCKKLLCVILSLCISRSINVMISAADTPTNHWSSAAVKTLNGIYGDNTFLSNDTAITTLEIKNFLTAINWETSVDFEGDDKLSRGEACEILADVFKLPLKTDGNNQNEREDAIVYLNRNGIIYGYANGELGKDDDITYAQFATLTYRILRTLGVALGTKTGLKPGTEEYFAYNYLKTRTMAVDLSATINRDKWNTWISKLNNISFNDKPSTAFTCEFPGNTTTQLEAAKKIVNEYIIYSNTDSIFADVTVGSFCYDGVMYLFDKGIVNGYGDGSGNFGPNDHVDRISLAVLLSRISPEDNPDTEGVVVNAPADTDATLLNYMIKAIANGYMSEPDENASEWWVDKATRKEVIIAIMKAIKANVINVNPVVLERFNDKSEFSADISPYIVYAVMLGIVRGTADGYLNLDGEVTRGELGVFLYRTLLGADSTKMQDYREIVNNVFDTAQK